MGWPRGVPRGPQTEAHRAKVVAALRAMWDTGKRAKDRVRWTPEMDETLVNLRRTVKYRCCVEEGATLIGVSATAVERRLRELGLTKKSSV